MPDPHENTLRITPDVSFGSPAATTGAMESDRNPLAMLALALAAGVAFAKWIDWRGHAHPRR
jgi:hypothetical protein